MDITKKPPDKYRTIKCSFKQIIKNKEDGAKIFDAVIRTHKIVTHTYQFLRLFILYNYKKKTDLRNLEEIISFQIQQKIPTPLYWRQVVSCLNWCNYIFFTKKCPIF